MANASWIYAALAGFVVGILCVAVPDTFLDDLSERFLWTKGGYYWTKARLGLAAAGFRVLRRCKTTISAWAESLAIATPEIGAFPGRLVAGVQQQGLTPRANALSYAPSLRRWGERFLPHAAVGSIQLKPAQQRAVSALTADPASELTRGQYEQLAGVSRSQAAYDLAELVEVGLLGIGRATASVRSSRRSALDGTRGPRRPISRPPAGETCTSPQAVTGGSATGRRRWGSNARPRVRSLRRSRRRRGDRRHGHAPRRRSGCEGSTRSSERTGEEAAGSPGQSAGEEDGTVTRADGAAATRPPLADDPIASYRHAQGTHRFGDAGTELDAG